MDKSLQYQKKVLALLSGRTGDFYLAGGTALANFYFNHRFSDDLDFFTQEYDSGTIVKLTQALAASLKKPVVLKAENTDSTKIRIAVYEVQIDKTARLKIDFVEDALPLLKPLRIVDGIPVLALEDIYLRKVYAATGTIKTTDIIGRAMTTGGRQVAKDFYDLYCLSHTFMSLSQFAFKYTNPTVREGLVRWFRSYDRMNMKSGLLDLKTRKKRDYREIEKHFKQEIDAILEQESDIL